MAPRTDTLKSTIDDLIATLKPAANAAEALAAAKEDATSLGASSIRAFAKRASTINAQLTEEEIDRIADEVATGAYTGASIKVRKSEIGTLLSQRRHLPAILTGVDQIATALKAHDPKASPLNIRQQVITAARALKKDNTATVTEVMTALRGKVLKKPPSPTEKARALVERLRSEAAWRVKVGDETMLDQDADAALTVLDNLLDGKRPDKDDTVPLADYEELQSRIEDLEKRLDAGYALAGGRPHAYEEAAEVLGDAIADAASSNWGSPTIAEPLEGPQDGDVPDGIPDASQPAIAVQPVTQAIPEGTKRRSTSQSLTGYDIDELLDMSKKK